MVNSETRTVTVKFLSIQAQDFIEELGHKSAAMTLDVFLSIQAQDFIEE